MTRPRVVVLDNEAVQALLDPAHRKHRRVLAAVEVVAARRGRGVGAGRLVVPTAVRVEAGWDRRTSGAAGINRLRVEDAPLDRGAADRASEVQRELGVSVADAHLAAVLGDSAPARFAVLTSDASDVRRIAAYLGAEVTVVAL